MEEIIAAARKARIHEFIQQLPQVLSRRRIGILCYGSF